MKRHLLSVLATILPLCAMSDTVTVNVETEGTLQELITNLDVTRITDLKITGKLNAADIAYLRVGTGRLVSLETLDLKEVSLIASDEPYLTIIRKGQFGASDDTWNYYISDEERVDSIKGKTSSMVLDYDTPYNVSYYNKNLTGAFQGMTSLKKVVMPSSTRKIGFRTFYQCTSLETIEADNLTEIGMEAFYQCCSLQSMDITSTVEVIGTSAFEGCSQLVNVGNLSNVRQMGAYAFRSTNLVGDADNVLDLSNLSSIPYSAFDGCKGLTKIRFSNNLKIIEGSAFCYCSNIESIVLPEGLLSIGHDAFRECTLLASVSLPNSLEKIDLSSFRGTKWYTSLIGESGESGIVYFGNVAVGYSMSKDENNNDVSPESLTFREGTIGIGDDFSYLDKWGNVCSSCKQDLTSVSFPSTLRYIGIDAFSNSNITKLELPEGLQSIGDYAFRNCTKLDDFELPSTITSIGYYAFEGCTYLSKIDIPENIAEMKESFNNCTGVILATIHAKELSLLKGSLGNLPGIERIVIGSEVEVLPEHMVSTSQSNIVKVSFNERSKDSRLYICKYALPYSSMENITFPDCKIELGGSALEYIYIPVEILGEVTKLGESALSGCEGIKTIRLSDEMTDIAEKTFYECSGIESIVLPSKLISIGEMAFYNCDNLSTVEVSEGLRTIGESAFAYCENLASINLPQSIENIGPGAFRECRQLQNIQIPEKVSKLEDYTFGYCSSLTSIIIPSSVESIGSCAFSSCQNLKNVTLQQGLKKIGDNAFNSCSNLEDINIPSTVEEIDLAAFAGCSSLKELTLSSGIKVIGEKAFSNCSGLEHLSIPASVLSIGEGAFYNCNLKKIVSLIEEPFDIPYNTFYFYDYDIKGRRIVDATLYVPAGTKSLYESTTGWNEFSDIIEMDGLVPVEKGDETNYTEYSTITEETDLNGTVVNNMFYNISTDAGGYNAEEGCIIITQDTSDEQMKLLEGLDINADELRNNFTGIIFKMSAGSGKVTVNAETTGNMTLKVKIGDGKPVEMELSGKLKINIPYEISEESLVYIYAGTTDEAPTRGLSKASTESSLKIYGIEWTSDNSGEDSYTPGDANGDGIVNAADIVKIVNYITTGSTENFNYKAADINGDDVINTSDIVEIMNIIMGSPEKQSNPKEEVTEGVGTVIYQSPVGDTIYCNGIYAYNDGAIYFITKLDALNQKHFKLSFDFTPEEAGPVLVLSEWCRILEIVLDDDMNVWITTNNHDNYYQTKHSCKLNQKLHMEIIHNNGTLKVNGETFQVSLLEGDSTLTSVNFSNFTAFKGTLENIVVTSY